MVKATQCYIVVIMNNIMLYYFVFIHSLLHPLYFQVKNPVYRFLSSGVSEESPTMLESLQGFLS